MSEKSAKRPAVKAPRPSMSVRQMSDGKLWLSIDKKVTPDIAMKVMELLKDASEAKG
jgi:hypothetical protein